jgi:ribosomal-protein-serine acetyltransferase
MKPILLDIPDHFETERLLMRLPHNGEGRIYNEAVNSSIAELRVFMRWAKEEHTLEEDEEYVRRAQSLFILRERFIFFIIHKDTQEFLGCMILHHIDWDIPKFEVGYWLRTSTTGKGYATEATRGVIQYAIEHLGAKRLDACCDEDNSASMRVLERSGFTYLATFRHNSVKNDGRMCNLMFFELIPE